MLNHVIKVNEKSPQNLTNNYVIKEKMDICNLTEMSFAQIGSKGEGDICGGSSHVCGG